MTPRYFVTGTDTGVGKTQVSAALLRLMVKRGHRPFAFKPFESGMASLDAPGDGLALQHAGGGWQPLETVSLFRFRAPLAPAMAARRERRTTSWRAMVSTFASFGGGAGVVEGAGGLRVPLDSRHDVIDAIAALKLPAVVVARSALGTINHTTLTLEALAARRLRVAAVVMVSSAAGSGDPSVALNKAELEARFPGVRFLGPVPFLEAVLPRARAFERALSTLV